MKFITVCDYTGIIECELFAVTYRRFGLATVQFTVVEVEANGYALRQRLELHARCDARVQAARLAGLGNYAAVKDTMPDVAAG